MCRVEEGGKVKVAARREEKRRVGRELLAFALTRKSRTTTAREGEAEGETEGESCESGESGEEGQERQTRS